MPYHVRDVEQVVAEFAADGQPYAVFVDNNLGSRPAYLRALCRALRPLERIWSAAVTIDVTDDPSLVREMALAGCTGVFVGFESLAGQNLADARKRTPRPDDYARRVGILHDHGIQVNGSFVLGFDTTGPTCSNARSTGSSGPGSSAPRSTSSRPTRAAAVPADGGPGPAAAPRLGAVRHGPRRLPAQAHDRAAAGRRLRLVLPAAVRPRQHLASPPGRPGGGAAYLAMSYLYKRSNRLWHHLIRHDLTAAAWRPLVEWTRRRHVRFRRRLAVGLPAPTRAAAVVAAGV